MLATDLDRYEHALTAVFDSPSPTLGEREEASSLGKGLIETVDTADARGAAWLDVVAAVVDASDETTVSTRAAHLLAALDDADSTPETQLRKCHRHFATAHGP